MAELNLKHSQDLNHDFGNTKTAFQFFYHQYLWVWSIAFCSGQVEELIFLHIQKGFPKLCIPLQENTMGSCCSFPEASDHC